MAKKQRQYTFSRFFKDLDLFGYPVQLNFDEKGATHRTCCGGVSSIVFMILVVVVILSQITVLTSKSQSLYSSHEFPFDSNKTKSSDLADASLGVGTFMIVYDANGNSDQTQFTTQTVSNVKQKLSVMYGEGGTYAEAVQCDESHFNGTIPVGDESVWDQLSGLSGSMFCPS